MERPGGLDALVDAWVPRGAPRPPSNVPVGTQTKHTTLGQAQAEVQEVALERLQHATWQEDLRDQEPVPVAGQLAMATASSRDAPQPAASARRGAPQPVMVSSAIFVKNQKRKRWHRHLQRICGSKQVWEILSFTGCFEPALIQAAVMRGKDGQQDEEAVRRVCGVRRVRLCDVACVCV